MEEVNMNISKMVSDTVNLYRQLDAKNQKIWKPGTHVSSSYVSLNIHMSELAKSSGMLKTDITVPSGNRDYQLENYVKTLRDFLLIANLQSWTDIINVDEQTLNKLSAMKKTDDLNSLYLSMLNMLLKSYYEKSKIGYKHAWTLFLKFGIVDLGFQAEEITDKFDEMIQNDLNTVLDNH